MPLYLEELALSVARCSKLVRAAKETEEGRHHPCRKIVDSQEAFAGGNNGRAHMGYARAVLGLGGEGDLRASRFRITLVRAGGNDGSGSLQIQR